MASPPESGYRPTSAFRVTRRPFADLSGEGARLVGGRWNSPGRAALYLAESRAMAPKQDDENSKEEKLKKILRKAKELKPSLP